MTETYWRHDATTTARTDNTPPHWLTTTHFAELFRDLQHVYTCAPLESQLSHHLQTFGSSWHLPDLREISLTWNQNQCLISDCLTFPEMREIPAHCLKSVYAAKLSRTSQILEQFLEFLRFFSGYWYDRNRAYVSGNTMSGLVNFIKGIWCLWLDKVWNFGLRAFGEFFGGSWLFDLANRIGKFFGGMKHGFLGQIWQRNKKAWYESRL